MPHPLAGLRQVEWGRMMAVGGMKKVAKYFGAFRSPPLLGNTQKCLLAAQ